MLSSKSMCSFCKVCELIENSNQFIKTTLYQCKIEICHTGATCIYLYSHTVYYQSYSFALWQYALRNIVPLQNTQKGLVCFFLLNQFIHKLVPKAFPSWKWIEKFYQNEINIPNCT